MKGKILISSFVLSIVLLFIGLQTSGTKIKILLNGTPAANKEYHLLLNDIKITLDENGEYVFPDDRSQIIILKQNYVIQNKPNHTVIFDIQDKKHISTITKYYFKLGPIEVKETTTIEGFNIMKENEDSD